MRKLFRREFWTRKRIVIGVLIVGVALAAGSFAMDGGGGPAGIQTDKVKRMHLEQTVLSTGEVVSSVDLSLSFQSSGVVRQVLVKEGQKVKAGATLATLDQASVRASLTSAQGSLAQAQANYNKILAGASNEDIQVSKAAVASAQTAVESAYSVMLNSGLDAIPSSGNTSDGTIEISGTYPGAKKGQYSIHIEGLNYVIRNENLEATIVSRPEKITRGVPLAIGTKGLYMTFSYDGEFKNKDEWIVPIPNTQASSYLANLNTYEAAKKALEQAEAALALKQAEARPPDLQAAQAQVLSAQGQVAAAQANYNNTVIRAPSSGTITRVNTRVGEQAVASQEVMILQDVASLHTEANVSESDIASIKVGQEVDYTFDALGPDRHFAGKVQVVNPASTVISGVVNYKVTASIEDASEIKPGMTANMTVLVARKEDALAVPSNAILNKNGGKYVRVIEDAERKTYHETEVKTGLNADGGLVEIVSGLTEGQEIVTSI